MNMNAGSEIMWKRKEDFSRERVQLFSTAGQWPRFTKYEIVEVVLQDEPETLLRFMDREFKVAPPKLFVRPAKDAKFRDWYKPLDHHPEILQDFLLLIRSLDLSSNFIWQPFNRSDAQTPSNAYMTTLTFEPDPKSEDSFLTQYYRSKRRQAELLLRFCNKWGQFGKAWNKSVMRTALDFVRGESSSSMPPGYLDYLNKHSSLNSTKLLVSSIMLKVQKDLRDIGENVDALYSEMMDFWADFSDWENFRTAVSDPKSEYRTGLKWADRLSGIQVESNLRVRFDGKLQLDYGFDSLLQALRLMFMLTMVSDVQQVKLCALPDCRNPFVVQSAKAQNVLRGAKNEDIRSAKAIYCSDSCAVKDRVRRHRAREKKQFEAARLKAKTRNRAKKHTK
jgi:hypothetical protein